MLFITNRLMHKHLSALKNVTQFYYSKALIHFRVRNFIHYSYLT